MNAITNNEIIPITPTDIVLISEPLSLAVYVSVV
mgnify:CR=1 FL=1